MVEFERIYGGRPSMFRAILACISLLLPENGFDEVCWEGGLVAPSSESLATSRMV